MTAITLLRSMGNIDLLVPFETAVRAAHLLVALKQT